LAQLGEDGKITLTTQQVYGNCPQYIQARDVVTMADLKESISVTASTLDNSQQRRIEKADTFFIASAHPVSGADASHRGGKPGFIRIENDSRLLFPDYSATRCLTPWGILLQIHMLACSFPTSQAGPLYNSQEGQLSYGMIRARKIFPVRNGYWRSTWNVWRTFAQQLSCDSHFGITHRSCRSQR
jgi:hypothetical protein